MRKFKSHFLGYFSGIQQSKRPKRTWLFGQSRLQVVHRMQFEKAVNVFLSLEPSIRDPARVYELIGIGFHLITNCLKTFHSSPLQTKPAINQSVIWALPILAFARRIRAWLVVYILLWIGFEKERGIAQNKENKANNEMDGKNRGNHDWAQLL